MLNFAESNKEHLVKLLRSTSTKEHRNFFNEPKSITSAGSAFHIPTFIYYSLAKKWARVVV